MARVRDIAIDEVPEDCKPVYRRYAEEYGPFLNQVKIFAHRPTALKHIMGMLLDMAEEAVLPKRYLEIALVVVAHSAANLVDECLGLGLHGALLNDVRRGPASAPRDGSVFEGG